MPMENLFVFTADERAAAMGLDDEANARIIPRAVDNASPGVGLNLNDAASNYEPADVVTLVNKFVAPKRIVDDPAYLQYCPALITYLLTLPWCSLETETIFLPPPQD